MGEEWAKAWWVPWLAIGAVAYLLILPAALNPLILLALIFRPRPRRDAPC